MENPYAIWEDFGFKNHILVFGTDDAEAAWYLAEQFLLGQSDNEVYYCTGLSSGDGFEKLDAGHFKFPVKTYDQTPEQPVQTSLFSYSTDGAYRGTLQIVAENLACANTALVHFLDEEEMGEADPPMSSDDWDLTFVCPVGGDIQRIDGDVTIPQGESVVLDYDWIVNEK